MELTETLRKYEIIIIVDAKLTADQKSAILKNAVEVIQKNGMKVINSQVWLEKQKFTAHIKKQAEGTYYLINTEGDGEGNKKIREDFRLNEGILRFAVTKID